MKYLFAFLFVFLNAVGYAQKEECMWTSKVPRAIDLGVDSVELIKGIVCNGENYSIYINFDSATNYNTMHIYIASKDYDKVAEKLKQINSQTNNSLSKTRELHITYFQHKYKLYPPLDYKFDSLKKITIDYFLEKSNRNLSNKNVDKWKVFFDNHPHLVDVDLSMPTPMALAEDLIKNRPNVNKLNLLFLEPRKDIKILDSIAAYKPNLQALSIDMAGDTLPAMFANLTQLNSINFQNVSDKNSFRYIENFSQLEKISISLNVKKGYEKTLLSISKLTNLTSLSLSVSNSKLVKMQLPQEFKALQKIQNLKIPNIDICAPENAYIFDILQNMPDLGMLKTGCGNYNLINDDLGLKFSKVIKKPTNEKVLFITLSRKNIRKLRLSKWNPENRWYFIKDKERLLSGYLKIPLSVLIFGD